MTHQQTASRLEIFDSNGDQWQPATTLAELRTRADLAERRLNAAALVLHRWVGCQSNDAAALRLELLDALHRPAPAAVQPRITDRQYDLARAAAEFAATVQARADEVMQAFAQLAAAAQQASTPSRVR